MKKPAVRTAGFRIILHSQRHLTGIMLTEATTRYEHMLSCYSILWCKYKY